MAELKTKSGKTILIDDADLERVGASGWYVDSSGYARKDIGQRGNRTTIKMHRFILGLADSSVHVDHINGNRLDNRRANLRECSIAENARNSATPKRSTTGLKGVCFSTYHGKYKAHICVDRKKRHLGYFDTPEDAHAAYCRAADTHHGDFARHG